MRRLLAAPRDVALLFLNVIVAVTGAWVTVIVTQRSLFASLRGRRFDSYRLRLCP